MRWVLDIFSQHRDIEYLVHGWKIWWKSQFISYRPNLLQNLIRTDIPGSQLTLLARMEYTFQW